MNKEKIEKLKADFITKAGIDLDNYNKPELYEKISNLITFPQYGLKSVKKAFKFCFLILILIVAAWIFISGKTGIGIVVFIVGLPLILINSVIIGLLILLDKTKTDLTTVVELSLDITQNAINDLQTINEAKNNLSALPSVTQLLSGIIHTAVLPNLLGIIRTKIPLIGKFIASLVTQIIDSFTDKIEEKENTTRANIGIDKKIKQIDEQSDKYFEKSISVLENIKAKTNQTMDIVVKVSGMPIKIIAVLWSAISLLIIALILLFAY